MENDWTMTLNSQNYLSINNIIHTEINYNQITTFF